MATYILSVRQIVLCTLFLQFLFLVKNHKYFQSFEAKLFKCSTVVALPTSGCVLHVFMDKRDPNNELPSFENFLPAVTVETMHV